LRQRHEQVVIELATSRSNSQPRVIEIEGTSKACRAAKLDIEALLVAPKPPVTEQPTSQKAQPAKPTTAKKESDWAALIPQDLMDWVDGVPSSSPDPKEQADWVALLIAEMKEFCRDAESC
jgi:hypothetical protein